MLKPMSIEEVRPFNGLDVFVARDAGLFEAEGLDLQIASRGPGDMYSTANGTLENPVSVQGHVQARGAAQMYQA